MEGFGNRVELKKREKAKTTCKNPKKTRKTPKNPRFSIIPDFFSNSTRQNPPVNPRIHHFPTSLSHTLRSMRRTTRSPRNLDHGGTRRARVPGHQTTSNRRQIHDSIRNWRDPSATRAFSLASNEQPR